jgi:phosphotransacetylase
MSVEFQSFDDILAAVQDLPPLPVAVVDAEEEHVLQGASEGAKAGYIDPILIGEEERIRTLLERLGIRDPFTVIQARSEEEAAEAGVTLIMDGKAKALMKGHLHTDQFLHPILAHHLQGKGRLSHVFIADLKTYPKLLYLTDAAINISPDLLIKADIVRNAVALGHRMGLSVPKVAALSAVENINPAIPSTVDAACLAKMADRGQISGALVDGPLAFDNAISAESARIKGIRSEVSGDADILLVPDLVSGNILAKDLEYLAGARLAGLVVGSPVPIILTSRADPPDARSISCAVAKLVDHRQATEVGAGQGPPA